MANKPLPYRDLSTLNEQQLWMVIADKIACITGCEVPPHVRNSNKRVIMEWVASHISAIAGAV